MNNKNILFGLFAVATGGLIFLLVDKNKSNKVQPSFSGCDGLNGNESTDNMCNHLSSEHEHCEKELRNILASAKNGKNCTKDVIDVWDREINHHFQEEENVVFPKLLKKDSSLKSSINDLLNDHKFFYSAIADMKRLGNCQRLSVLFCNRLLNHIQKEEKLFATV
jgi:hypothetical protein